MSRFYITKKKHSSAPDAEDWVNIVLRTPHVDFQGWTMDGKMKVEHPDEVVLHVAISDVADMQRV